VTKRLTIALDAMGGDLAPTMVVEGAALAVNRFPHVDFLFFGDEERLAPLVAAHPHLSKTSTIYHADDVVTADDKPSVALRSRRQSSMRLAIDAVKDKGANAVVSAGNTGALMAISKVVLKTLEGIDRPAIASSFPTVRGSTCMLDLGANVQCTAENLVQFAVMGEVFARTVLGVDKPTIGLLNIGVEELKGHYEVREAAAILRASDLPIEFYGFIEGDDIPAGTVDVVVTDGFSGNISIKTMEGSVRFFADFMRNALTSSIFARIGAVLARGAIARMRARLDPRHHNGAILMGLNGIVVKSHGGTDALGFDHAIEVAVGMVDNDFFAKMSQDFERLQADQAHSAAAAVS
jgi:glycerol-3-phosphate acyltransferase PlsX